jgi:molybdate transport repressor ModE-like protein
MRLEPALHWLLDGRELDSRLMPLLQAIRAGGSLSRAVRETGLSYRHAWGLIGALENTLGAPLIRRERGRGAYLTALGEKLLAAQLALADRMTPALEKLGIDIDRNLAQLGADRRLVVFASHDLALARLRDHLNAAQRCHVELHFHGSLDSLAALARGQCDFAGFHVPDSVSNRAVLDQYRPWLKPRSLQVLHFVTRQQGLIVARGNPLRIYSLADLVRTKARFVNRQPGAGTRLLLDHLLATHHIRPAQINGYQLEEFTHAAVAATIASGMADAGFGIEAAARQQRLDFVPLVGERYYLAARSATLARPGPAAFIAALRSGALRQALRNLPGYAAPPAFEAIPAQRLLA